MCVDILLHVLRITGTKSMALPLHLSREQVHAVTAVTAVTAPIVTAELTNVTAV